MAVDKIKQTTDTLPVANTSEWAWFKIVSNVLKFNSDGTNTRSVVSTDQTQTLTNKTLTAPTLTSPALTTATMVMIPGLVPVVEANSTMKQVRGFSGLRVRLSIPRKVHSLMSSSLPGGMVEVTNTEG